MDEDTAHPLPWSIHESEACFWIEDARGRRFGYTYFRAGPSMTGPHRKKFPKRKEALRMVTAHMKRARERDEFS